jgi:hypothetical protein
MQMVITVFGLLGAMVTGLWIAFTGQQRDDRQRVATPPPRHRAPVLANGWTGKPMSTRTLPLDGPRVQRRGFGTHLAGRPVRRRTWSEFAYAGMWTELHR